VNIKLLLSHFHPTIGPQIFLSYPKADYSNFNPIIQVLMDYNFTPNHLTEYSLHGDQNIKFYNYYFELNSTFARGNREIVMLTAVTEVEVNTEFLTELFGITAQKMKSFPNIFKGFYLDTRPSDSEITKEFQKLQILFDNCYASLEKKNSQRVVVDRLFDMRNVQIESETLQILKTLLNTLTVVIDARVPEGKLMLYDTGLIIGEKFEHLFKHNTPNELVPEIKQFWKKHNLGDIDEVVMKPKRIEFSVYDCYECSEWPNVGETVCKLDEGIITKLLNLKLNGKFNVTETECYATGNDHCRFVITPNMVADL